MPDLSFPRLHIRPDRGWLNDPNGVCRIDGVYHVFFQHNPYGPDHDAIHWGHVSSTDLLTWAQQPTALAPRPGEVDAAGCWSGCAVDDGGVPTAVYTAVPDHAGHAGVALARSDRSLRIWQQRPTFVMGPPATAGTEEVRDPFVFSSRGCRFAVQGAGARRGRPQLLLYGCDDLEHWTELGPLITGDDPVAAELADANIWECPNLALVDGEWVLLVSRWCWRDETHELAGVRYLLGDLVEAGAGLRFSARTGGLVDTGPAFYAPQLLAGGDRTLVWGWAWEMGRTEEQIEAAGWAGVLTFPRELFVRHGVLGTRPAAELTGLRRGELAWEPGSPFAESAFEVLTTGPARLRLVDDGSSVLVADLEPGARLLVDGSMVEVFTDGVACTTRAYPTATGGWVLDADEGDVTAYRLGI